MGKVCSHNSAHAHSVSESVRYFMLILCRRRLGVAQLLNTCYTVYTNIHTLQTYLIMKDLSLLERDYKILSSKKRLHILLYLKRKHAATVGDIADAIHLTKFATSQHLRILRNLNVVVARKRKSFITYRLSLKQTAVIKGALKLL